MKSPVATVMLIREDGSLLLQHRDDKPGLSRANMWVPPGGHCECDEPTLECARREMLEETDYQCDSSLKFLKTIIDDAGNGHIYPLSIYWAFYDGKQKLTCHEGQGLEFIARKDAAHYDIPGNIIVAWDEVLSAAKVR